MHVPGIVAQKFHLHVTLLGALFGTKVWHVMGHYFDTFAIAKQNSICVQNLSCLVSQSKEIFTKEWSQGYWGKGYLNRREQASISPEQCCATHSLPIYYVYISYRAVGPRLWNKTRLWTRKKMGLLFTECIPFECTLENVSPSVCSCRVGLCFIVRRPDLSYRNTHSVGCAMLHEAGACELTSHLRTKTQPKAHTR